MVVLKLTHNLLLDSWMPFLIAGRVYLILLMSVALDAISVSQPLRRHQPPLAETESVSSPLPLRSSDPVAPPVLSNLDVPLVSRPVLSHTNVQRVVLASARHFRGFWRLFPAPPSPLPRAFQPNDTVGAKPPRLPATSFSCPQLPRPTATPPTLSGCAAHCMPGHRRQLSLFYLSRENEFGSESPVPFRMSLCFG